MDGIDSRPFDTNVFFSGGAGMFLQYHDVVKPTYLMIILRMLMGDKTYGLPISSIKNLSILSLVEWYLNRRYINPLRCLDYEGQASPDELDALLRRLLADDDSLYKLSPTMNVSRLLSTYAKQRMTFPVYVYTEIEEPFISVECKNLFPGVPVKYIHGDLTKALERCDQNFTYIVSNIDLCKRLAEKLTGTYSHLLLASDYRYNMKPRSGDYREDIRMLMAKHPYVRLETMSVCDPSELAFTIRELTSNFDNRKEI